MSKFDLEKMYEFVVEELKKFEDDEDEKLCGFAISDGLISMNTVECFDAFVSGCRNDGDLSPVEDLRRWVGDYEYDSCSDLRECEGFSNEALEEYRCMDDEDQSTSEYAMAMKKLMEILVERKAFDSLNRSDDFFTIITGHIY